MSYNTGATGLNGYVLNDFETTIPDKEKKRRGRKPKKPSEKQLLNMYFEETGKKYASSSSTITDKSSEDIGYVKQKSVYENFQHISPADKGKFESKFTKPKNKHQEYYVSLLRNKNKKIVVATGPAGTGKTMFATEFAVKNFLNGTYEKLVFTRPSVTVDEDLGYLPGTLEEKMAPWVRPIYDVLYQFTGPREVQQYMEDKHIEIAPLGFMRGRTFKNTWIVADEMQNSTISQMKMLLTRLGENSRLIITGDLEQYDRPNELNGLEDFLDKFKGKRSSSISSFEFERSDIQREEVVKEVLDIYSGDVPDNYIDDEEEEEKEEQ